jgi:hypothetical protein
MLANMVALLVGSASRFETLQFDAPIAVDESMRQ